VLRHRCRPGALVLAFLMTSCGTPTGGSPNGDPAPPGPATSAASQPAPAPAGIPFVDFLTGVRHARYADYTGKPGTAVRGESAFEEMRRYLLDRYGGVQVSHSYTLGGADFDCIGSESPAPPGSVCPAGSVPVRRVTLAELVRFPTLQSFLGKGPDGGALPPVPSPPR
jgi:hypothetical protein